MGIFNLNQNNYKIISDINNYKNLNKYSNVWKDNTFPEKQWRRVEKQLNNIPNVPEFQAIIECVKSTKTKNPSILDIGCSSGYLSEVFNKTGIKCRYEGTDYSKAFIDFAMQKFPEEKFSINDATKLKYKDKSFDIAVSACCLLHIINYKKAISEVARVAKKYVIFHRTPVYSIQPTTFFTKTAYNAEMLEIVFNEDELVDIFRKNNLSVIKIKTISGGENMTIKNYLCCKE